MLRKIHSYQRPLLQCGQNIAVALQNRRRQSAAPATRLIYMQNPWSWLCNKMRLKMLQYTWDREFSEVDFKRGVKQATATLTQHVRTNQLHGIQSITTPKGYEQIVADMLVSRDDPRVHMMHFRLADIRRAIPVRVHLLQGRADRRHCFVDMFAVGLRRASDMSPAERSDFWRHWQRYDRNVSDATMEPAVFAEMFVRFHREYSESSPDEWNIAYYKVASFDVLAL